MWFHKADWLDFNSIQSGHYWGATNYGFVTKDYKLSPAKPTVDMEPAYENHPSGDKPRIDSHQVRAEAYAAMLAGAADWARCECHGGAQDIPNQRRGPDSAQPTGTEDIHGQDDAPGDV